MFKKNKMSEPLLSLSPVEEYSEQSVLVSKVKEVLPNYDDKYIESLLKKNNYDVIDTINNILKIEEEKKDLEYAKSLQV